MMVLWDTPVCLLDVGYQPAKILEDETGKPKKIPRDFGFIIANAEDWTVEQAEIFWTDSSGIAEHSETTRTCRRTWSCCLADGP